MADYNTMKVPELKKLLSERGLTQAGNKADLIARLVDDDKQKAKASESSGDKEIPNEIDYEDDDDIPATTNDAAIATATKATSSAPAATNPAAPAKPALDVSAAPADAPAAANTATDGDDKKTTGGATETSSLVQGLAPTNAKTEAERRAARAARFGITYADDSEEARKAARAERFGVANDAVAALDSALPDRPRKRGRGGDEAQEDSRTNKRQSNGPAQTQGSQRNGSARSNNNQGGRNQGGRGGRQNRRGGGPKESGNTNGRQNQQKSAPAIDASEKAKMEARAKRFAN